MTCTSTTTAKCYKLIHEYCNSNLMISQSHEAFCLHSVFHFYFQYFSVSILHITFSYLGRFLTENFNSVVFVLLLILDISSHHC